MDPSKIAQMTDAGALRNLMDNARQLEREDIYCHAFKRLCALEGIAYDDPLFREFFHVLNAYEELLTEKHGRMTKANRTRQKLKSKGVEQCLIDWAMGPATEGFKLLLEKGLPELTAEYLVLKYEGRFPSRAVEAARRRLEGVGAVQASD